MAATLDLVLDGETGVRHLANAGAITWADFARSLADALDLDAGLVSEVPHLQLNWAAPRPPPANLAILTSTGNPRAADAS